MIPEKWAPVFGKDHAQTRRAFSRHAVLFDAPQPPADHGRLDGIAGLVIAPLAIDKAAGERQLIRSAVVLAEHLDRLFGRRCAKPVELRQPLFPRCHLSPCPLTGRRGPSPGLPVHSIYPIEPQAMNAPGVWYL